MLSTTKLFLLLILFVVACPGGDRRSAPTPLDQNQKAEHSGEVSELQQDLAATLNKITTLQGQMEQGDGSQEQVQSLQQELTAAEDKIAQLAKEGKISSDTVQDLKNTVIGLWGQLGKLQQRLDDSDTTDPNGTDPEQPTGDAPVLHVSLVELEQETADRKAGTYVTFHSNKDVEINNIKYDSIELSISESSPTQLKSMKLPVSVGFTHTGTPYCVSATLGLANLPSDTSEGKKEKMAVDTTEGACQP